MPNLSFTELIFLVFVVIIPVLRIVGRGLKKLGEAGSNAAVKQDRAHAKRLAALQRGRTEMQEFRGDQRDAPFATREYQEIREDRSFTSSDGQRDQFRSDRGITDRGIGDRVGADQFEEPPFFDEGEPIEYFEFEDVAEQDVANEEIGEESSTGIYDSPLETRPPGRPPSRAARSTDLPAAFKSVGLGPGRLSDLSSTAAYDIDTDAYGARKKKKAPSFVRGNLKQAARNGVIWRELLNKPVAFADRPPGSGPN